MRTTTQCARAMAILVATSAADAAPSFTLLHAADGRDRTVAMSVSNDGRFVGGYSSLSTLAPIIWDGETPVTLDVPAGIESNRALVNAVAGDGRSAAGYGYTASGIQGVRWDATGAAHLLPTDPESSSAYYAMNDAGTAAAGMLNDSIFTGAADGAVWTDSDGVRNIGGYPGVRGVTALRAVSDDGLRFAGHAVIDGMRPIVWSSSDGFGILSPVAGSTGHGGVEGLSPDGGTAVGHQDFGGLGRPVYWDESGAAHEINLWPGFDAGFAYAASESGGVIVGRWVDTSFGGSGENKAFIWDPEHGARPLQDVLIAELGLDLGGWSLLDAVDITPDGKTIVGVAMDEFGSQLAYKVVIPAPGVLPLLVLGGLAAGRRRR